MTDKPDDLAKPSLLWANDILKPFDQFDPGPKKWPDFNNVKSIDEKVLKDREIKELWWVGRQWAVTSYGLECISDAYYFIKRAQLREPGWRAHMAEKDWVDIQDFTTAFYVALTLHHITLPDYVLWQPKQHRPTRDNYDGRKGRKVE